MTPDREAICSHVRMIHERAGRLARLGKLVVASFGEDPVTGNAIKAKVEHFDIGKADEMTAAILRLSAEQYRNVYTPLAVFKKGVSTTAKGKEDDVLAILAVVGDFDDADAARWDERLPLLASYALQTSCDRFQTFCLLAKPAPLRTVKPVAMRLKQFCGCDHGTADVSHVWRIPGTLNWPSKKKVEAGRPPEPQLVRVAQSLNGSVKLADLSAALTLPAPRDMSTPAQPAGPNPIRLDELPILFREALTEATQFGVKITHTKQEFGRWVAYLRAAGKSEQQAIELFGRYPGGLAKTFIKERRLDQEIHRIWVKKDAAEIITYAEVLAEAKALTPESTPDAIDGIIRQVAAAKFSPIEEGFIRNAIRASTGQKAKAVDAEIKRAKVAVRSAVPAQFDEEPRSEDYRRVIKKFNDQYAVVNEAGKAVVYEQEYDKMLERKVLVRITFSDLKKFYQNRLLTIGEVTHTEANWWLNSAQRREYLGGVVFDPTGNAPANCWNLWSKFAVEPKQGDWSLMRTHIEDVICNGDTDSFDYLLDWTARMFQQPHRQGEVALCVRGLKGVGKGIFFQYLRKAWGQHGVYISNAKHLVGNFNAHLRDCVFLFPDEAFFAGDRQHESVLKALITDPVLPIEGKHQNLINVKNMLHIAMAANADWVVPASHDERRYFVLNATDKYRGDHAYFTKIGAQMDGDGLAAMIYEMLHRNITEFHVGAVPQTEALAEQKKLSLDTLDSWWLAVLERGFVWRSRHGIEEFTVWQDFVATQLLDRSYQQWCADNRISRPVSREMLGKRMTEIYGLMSRPSAAAIIGETENAGLLERVEGKVINKDELVQRKGGARGYRVGSLESAAEKFEKIRHVTAEVS
jgi:hypothetical protein